MKAIILAAGKSTRLRPITDKIPKTLLQVNNKEIISYMLDSLQNNGVKDIVICVGYRAKQIKEYCSKNYPNLNFIFVENKDYENTNNMYSLYLARDNFDDDIILFNGDSIHEPVIIQKMLKQQNTAMAVDTNSYDKESMKLIVDETGKIIKMSKEIPPKQCYGCSVDIFLIKKNDLVAVKNELERIIEKGKNVNEWIEVMFENLFRSAIINATAIDVDNKNWYEIDTYEDLISARKLFENN